MDLRYAPGPRHAGLRVMLALSWPAKLGVAAYSAALAGRDGGRNASVNRLA